MDTFKKGDTKLVAGHDMSGRVFYEEVKLVKRHDYMDGRWWVVRFQHGGSLSVHESRMEVYQ